MVSCFILSANYYQKTNQTFKKLQPTNVRGILLNNNTDNSYLELKKSLIEKYNDILSNKLQSLSCEYKEEIKTILGSDYILYIESLKLLTCKIISLNPNSLTLLINIKTLLYAVSLSLP